MSMSTRVRQVLLLCALALAVLGMHHLAFAPHGTTPEAPAAAHGAATEPTETESSMPGGEHGGGHGGMAEPGMMTEGEMDQLEQASGADFDRLWVEMMIKHHQGAVTMAKTELDKGSNAEATALAQQIVDAQEAEISEMRAMSPR